MSLHPFRPAGDLGGGLPVRAEEEQARATVTSTATQASCVGRVTTARSWFCWDNDDSHPTPGENPRDCCPLSKIYSFIQLQRLHSARTVSLVLKEDPGKFTPVSLASVPCKILENIILGSIEKYLEDNAGINHSQHSFMRRKSCLSSLISSKAG